MRNGPLAATLLALSLATACGGSEERGAALPDQAPRLAKAAEPIEASVSGMADPLSACRPANGQGAVDPAITIHAITFVVNGVERVLRNGDTLDARVGDEIGIGDVVICAGSFSGSGGEACVDFVPVDRRGEEILAAHTGTHMVPVTSGFLTVPGPDDTWSRVENWRNISAVLNHWTPGNTGDSTCANGLCEHDDWVIIVLR